MIITRTIARAAASTVVGAAISAGLFTGAGAASASDSQDAQFVSALKHFGITTTDPQQAARNGQIICAKLENGATVTSVVNQVGGVEPDLSTDDVVRYVGSAVGVYCPQIIPPGN